MTKQKRRGHGEGSIYQRKDGRWVAEITLEDGNRKPFYGKSKKDVQEKLRIAINEQKQGTLATGPQQKLKDYLEQWLEQVQKPTIRISSYVKQRKILNYHILPELGHIQLQKITAQQVQAFYAKKLEEKLSPGYIYSMHALLHKAFSNAVRWRLISQNICEHVSPPKIIKQELRTLNTEQIQRLLEAAQGHGLEALVTLALTTGMRHGELTALRWHDIIFEDGSLSIHRTLNYIAGYGFIEGEPKTARGKRRIPLPPFVLELLLMHRDTQEQARKAAGSKWCDMDLVFCTSVGTFIDPRSLLKRFHALLDTAGLPRMRIHDLRHSAATILMGMGIHPKVVQERLGHSQISMTLGTYSHVMPSMQQEVADKLDTLFRTPSPQE